MDIIAALHQEASTLETRLSAIRGAISALSSTNGHESATAETSKSRRTMSAAGRRRIIEATKRRWAKYRAEKSGKPKRTMSAATRRKISLSQRKRFAGKKG
jgi:hypothetical protein